MMAFDLPVSSWIAIFGLLVTLGGAGWAARAIIIDETTAAELAATKWDANDELRQALIDQSRAAKLGLILVAIGSGVQIVGVIVAARGL